MAATRIPQEWTDGERDLEEIIPKATTLFHETSEHNEKLDVLTFLCHELLPKLSLSMLEETFLCRMFPGLPLYVDKVFLEIEEIVQFESEIDDDPSMNKSQLLHDLLLVVLTVLKCVETCIKHTHETFQCISIHQVNSLPVPVLLIVKSTFSHCQKSESSYGELFSDVSQDLSLLFRKSFELQKLLLELLGVKMDALTNTCSENDLKNITSVCENLLDICEITERFDGNMTPGMWKSLMRLVMKNKEVIQNHLQGDRLVSQMCSTLEGKLQHYENLINSTTNTEAESSKNESFSLKVLKVLKFLMKLLMSFVQSFQDLLLASTFKDILRLIDAIISACFKKPTEKSAGVIAAEDTSTSLIITVEPFLKILVLNKQFADLFILHNEEILPNDNFSRCYCLANIVAMLPVISGEISSYWIKPENFSEDEPRVSVYEALLHSCDACFIEMSLPVELPGTMCNGRAQRMVSFYEYVVSRFSASISAIPCQDFHIIEKTLLRSVFDCSVICFSIATDVWCFMARWMTADLCYSHVKLFLHWLSTVTWKTDLQRNRLCVLVRRLVPLLAQEHQELLLQEYPPHSLDFLEIWSTMPLHKMIESVRTKAVQALMQNICSSLQKWRNPLQNLLQFELGKNLHCLQNFVSHDPVVLNDLQQEGKSDFIITTMRLFDTFMDAPEKISEFCWLNFMKIVKAILFLIEPEDFNKILNNVAKGVELFKDDILSLYFARVMAECGKLSFPIGQNESNLISKIFRALISSSQCLVHNEAFAALRRFAEVTPYTPVLEECVPDDMKEMFQMFICAIPYGGRQVEDKSTMLLNVLREQEATRRSNKICASSTFSAPVASKDLDKRKREVTDYESDAKRTRIEHGQISLSKGDEEILSSTLDELSRQLIKLQEVHSRNSQFPPEVCKKLYSMKTLLDAMVKSN